MIYDVSVRHNICGLYSTICIDFETKAIYGSAHLAVAQKVDSAQFLYRQKLHLYIYVCIYINETFNDAHFYKCMITC